MERFLKQFIYGISFLGILGGLVAGLYFGYFIPELTCTDNIQNQDETGVDCGGSCISCALKNAELNIGETIILPIGNSKITLITEAINPVQEYDAGFRYVYKILSTFGEVLYVIEDTSSVLRNGKRLIVAPGIPIKSDEVGSAEIEITDVIWTSTSTSNTNKITLEDINLIIPGEDSEEKNIKITGVIKNIKPDNIKKLRITGLLLDDKGSIIHASLLDINDIDGFSNTTFTVFFPQITELGTDVNPTNADILWEFID